MKCRVCNRKAKWVLTNIIVACNPFLCGIHARSLPYLTMNKMGYVENNSYEVSK
jgi:hypothetical protein